MALRRPLGLVMPRDVVLGRGTGMPEQRPRGLAEPQPHPLIGKLAGDGGRFSHASEVSRRADTERVGFDGADVEAIHVAQVEKIKAQLAVAIKLD
jgi:hypothetical protein